MATILVTGATGFIGRPLCAALLARDYHVKASVRLPAKDHRWDERIARFTADVENSRPDVWRKALDGVDTLIHLAARVHDRQQTDDQAFWRVNTQGTSRLSMLAVECGVRQIIYLSTIKVNGETSLQPVNESDSPRAQGPYAISKWRAEQRLKTITQGKECQYTIIRPPLVYGPRVRANFLSLLKLISADMPLPMGSLRNLRSMIYVGNLVDAIICAMDNPNAAGQVFMVSDGQDIALAELVKAIAQAMDQKPKVFPFPPSWLSCFLKIVGRGEMIDKLCQPLTADISKIRGTLGWRPPFPPSQGLAETVDWFRHCNPSG
jgi:nucleoside-diphosphate-sugar epimerase